MALLGGTTVNRDLELESQARRMAASPSLWLPFARFEEPRFRLKLPTGPEFEAWLLTWRPGQGTGLHDHGGSSGCFTVLEASVWETVVDPQGVAHETRYAAGDLRSFDEDLIHEVRNVGTVGAITLHLYRPHLTSMTHYESEGGQLRAIETSIAGRDW